MKKTLFLSAILFSFLGCSSDTFLEEFREDFTNNREWEKADSSELESLGCTIREDYSTDSLTPEIDCPFIGEVYSEGEPFNQHAYDTYIALEDYKLDLDSLKNADLSLIDSQNLLMLSIDVSLLKFDYLDLLPPEVRSELLNN